MAEYRVGIIGWGRGWAHASILPLFEEVRFVAVCDLSEERCARAAGSFPLEATYTDFAAFLDHDLDIVVVASPPMVHVEQSIAALESGRHVLCEVPLVYALDQEAALDQAHALVETVERTAAQSGTRFMFAENVNYWWFVRDWKARIDRGELGELVYLEAEYIHNCREIMRDASGALTWRAEMPPIFYCTHSLGPLLLFTEDRPARVVGVSTGSRIDPSLPAPDMEVALLTTEGGVVMKVLCGFKVAREPSHHYFSVYGTRGVVETVRNEAKARAHLPEVGIDRMAEIPFALSDPDAPPGAEAGGHGTAEYLMFRDFLRAIRGEIPVPIDVYAGLDMTLPGVFAHASALQGGVPLEIPDLRPKSP